MGRAWPGQHPRRLLRFDPGAYRRDGEGGRGAGAAAYPRRAGPHAARRARTLPHGGPPLMDEGATWDISATGGNDATAHALLRPATFLETSPRLTPGAATPGTCGSPLRTACHRGTLQPHAAKGAAAARP